MDTVRSRSPEILTTLWFDPTARSLICLRLSGTLLTRRHYKMLYVSTSHLVPAMPQRGDTRR